MKHTLTLTAVVFATACFGQVPDYMPTDGLLAWYPFNGNANDASGNGYAISYGAELTSDRLIGFVGFLFRWQQQNCGPC